MGLTVYSHTEVMADRMVARVMALLSSLKIRKSPRLVMALAVSNVNLVNEDSAKVLLSVCADGW